jgi:transposase
VFHFTPTACSWLNAIETFFATFTKRRLRRRVFRSITYLQATIHRCIAEHTTEPKQFVWTADPDRDFAAINRGKQAFESAH